MDPTSIQRLIESGEDSRTEFKSGAFHNESLAKEIVAFLRGRLMPSNSMLPRSRADRRITG